MTTTEQAIVLAISCWVAFMVGQSKAIAKTAPKNGASDTGAPAQSGSMDWFLNLSNNV